MERRISTALLAVAAPSAEASSFSYDLTPTADEQWQSRGVAHNYSYLSGYNDSGIVIECIKLTRTSDGSNYGPVVCTDGTGVANRHYAGDTGTYSWGKNDSPTNLCCWTTHMYEEW